MNGEICRDLNCVKRTKALKELGIYSDNNTDDILPKIMRGENQE